MRKLFCLDTLTVSLSDIADHLQEKLGVTLRVKPGDTQVHGVLFGNHFPSGNKVQGKYWCNEQLSDKEHTCVILVLYDKPYAATGTVQHVPHPTLSDVHHSVPEHVDSFAAAINATACHHDAEALTKHLDFFVSLR